VHATATRAQPVATIAAMREFSTKPCIDSSDSLYFQSSYAMGCTAIDLPIVSYNSGSNCLPGESRAL